MDFSQMDLLDTLAILSTILQMRNYQMELQSVDNDDIMQELQRQDQVYFKQIIQNQGLILRKLDELIELQGHSNRPAKR